MVWHSRNMDEFMMTEYAIVGIDKNSGNEFVVKRIERTPEQIASVKPKKRLAIRPVEITEKPSHNPLSQRLQQTVAIAADKVTYGWTVVARDSADRAAQVKAEADRRVDVVSGDTRAKLNAIMRAVLAIDKELGKKNPRAKYVSDIAPLKSLAAYMQAVRTEEARLLADPAATPNWPEA